MNKRVYEYFANFDQVKAKKQNNSIILNDSNVILDLSETKNNPFWNSSLAKYIIGKHKFFVKESFTEDCLFGIASSRMYGDLGLITPQVFRVIPKKEQEDYISIGSEDVYSIPNVEIATPEVVLHEILLQKGLTKYTNPPTMWDALRNDLDKEMFLEVMTQECFDELINLFMLDILRTDYDRHIANYFFYRRHGSSKFEGIIPIDLEYSHALQGRFADIEFDKFVKINTNAYTPCGHIDKATNHKERIRDIQGLIQTDKLSNNQISLLRHAINYNLPKKIEKMGLHYGIKDTYISNTIDPISKLWEYNYNQLSPELD